MGHSSRNCQKAYLLPLPSVCCLKGTATHCLPLVTLAGHAPFGDTAQLAWLGSRPLGREWLTEVKV